MDEWKTIGTARTASGSEFEFQNRGDEWTVRVDGRMLMSSRMHDSEEALAEQALDVAEEVGDVLVGGLGLGFTLRAVLDRAPAETIVTVAELVPELVEWNREHLQKLNDRALEDPRCQVVVGDVYELIRRSSRAFDVILLDVDNGPVALAQAKNQRLYSVGGVNACFAALRPGGVLAVWSAGRDARYEKRLASCGFRVDVKRESARAGSHAKHVIILGRR